MKFAVKIRQQIMACVMVAMAKMEIFRIVIALLINVDPESTIIFLPKRKSSIVWTVIVPMTNVEPAGTMESLPKSRVPFSIERRRKERNISNIKPAATMKYPPKGGCCFPWRENKRK